MARTRAGASGGSGGGGGAVAGGVIGQVMLDTSQVDPAIAKLNSSLSAAEMGFKATATAAASGGKGMASFGSSMMTAAAFADDMQYGLRAVVNQIPMVTTALGMGAGLGGVVSILAVGVNVLNNHWDSLVEKFSTRTIDTAAMEMERLGQKTGKTADEQKRLNELKREEAQIEQQKNRRTAGEQAAGGNVGKAVQEAPASVLGRDVRDVLMKEMEPAIEAATRKRVAAIESRLGLRLLGRKLTDEAVGALRDEERARRRPIANEQADQLIRGAEFGSGRELGALRRMAEQNPDMRGLARFRENPNPARGFAPVVDAHVQAWREQGGGRTDLEEAYAVGEAAAREEEARREALKQSDVDFQRRVDEVGAGIDLQMEENQIGIERFDEEQERARKYAEGMTGLREQYAEIMRGPVRVSQSMSADQYESSIKAHTGETEEAKQLKEIKVLQKQANELWRQFKPIGVIRRGGGGR
jgi:hypothetical protein